MNIKSLIRNRTITKGFFFYKKQIFDFTTIFYNIFHLLFFFSFHFSIVWFYLFNLIFNLRLRLVCTFNFLPKFIPQTILLREIITPWWNLSVTLRYINADLKISLYVCVHIKTIPCKFRILNPKNSRVIYAWSFYIFWKVG